MQAAPPPAAAAGASEVPSADDGPAAAAGAGGREAGSFGASMHAQALARRRAMGDEPRPRAARPGLQAHPHQRCKAPGLLWCLERAHARRASSDGRCALCGPEAALSTVGGGLGRAGRGLRSALCNQCHKVLCELAQCSVWSALCHTAHGVLTASSR